MEFTELTKKEFEKYLDKHELKSYLQTPEMANMLVQEGFEEYYVGVKEKGKILCATMMVSYKSKLKKFFNAPRGYLIDFKNKKLLEFFTENIKKYIKEHDGYVLNIEPKILYKERDSEGKIVEGGFDNTEIYENLIELGYKHNGFYLDLDLSKQVRWAYIIDIENKTEDEIFSNFKQNTRNIIRQAIKYGVKVRELEYDELDKLKKLVDSSGDRHEFHGRNLEYYQKMYKLFKPKEQVKFMIAEINMDEYIKILEKEKNELNKKLKKLSEAKANENRKKEYLSQIEKLDEKINIAKEKQEKCGNILSLAGAMFMIYGDEIVYLYSGTSTEHLMFKAQFLIQWEMIKYGIKNHYKIHNFYGISGTFSKDDKRYGVYIFKKSFGGNVIEYIGDFDLVISPLVYKIHKLLDKIRGGK